jgi:ADP-ribosylation factor-like protein 3
MFSALDATQGLLSSLFAKKAPTTKSVRMCVLGLDNAGKTTILKALTNEDIQYVMPT